MNLQTDSHTAKPLPASCQRDLQLITGCGYCGGCIPNGVYYTPCWVTPHLWDMGNQMDLISEGEFCWHPEESLIRDKKHVTYKIVKAEPCTNCGETLLYGEYVNAGPECRRVNLELVPDK